MSVENVIKVTARSLFQISRKDIWNIIPGTYEIEFEDGQKLTTKKKRIIFSRYAWELFHFRPDTPITKSCFVSTIIGDDSYRDSTHIMLLETIFKHICLYNNINTYTDKEPILKAVFQIVNLIYNEIVLSIGRHVSTIDATDFVNVLNFPEIKEIHKNLNSYPESIDKSYKEIKQALTSCKDSENNFVRAYRAKSVNENQSNQCIGPRGFVTDLDRTVFKQPILNGFIKGMGTLFELMAESRTAAKSINANDSHICMSEYASRRIQLLTMSVTHVHNSDCGSTEYMELYVAPNMLENLKGIYYLTPSGKLDWIKGNETHLINTTIFIRTIIGCKHPDPYKVCSTCLGKISENFKENSNLGYIMTADLLQKVTQSILSTKHLTHSVKKALIQLFGKALKYFYTTEENNIFFNKDIDLTGLVMILPNSRLNKLVDVLNTQHSNIALNKIGELEEIIIKDTKAKSPISDIVNISYRDRTSIITRELLEYIRNTTLESDARGNFVIPLDKFNKSFPIFHNPLKESNVITFVNRVTGIIETNKNKIDNPYEKLHILFTEVIEKFKCNFSILQVMIYATTTYNSQDNNYRLGRNYVTPKCESKSVLFRHRSIGQLFMFEEQSKEILTNAPVIFSNVKRSEHPLDVLFVPSAIVNKTDC